MTGQTSVPVRVLEVMPAIPMFGDAGHQAIVVSADPETWQATAGWEEYDWVGLRAEVFAGLDAMSRCVETRAVGFLGKALVDKVILHDLANVDEHCLRLLPADVRDGLERALHAIID